MNLPAEPVVLLPGEGRSYPMGAISAVFKADAAETAGRLSVSEWWLDPMREGPGAHSHADSEELFYVIAGTASILVRETWHSLPQGSFCLIPRGVTHDFRNEHTQRMGLFNVYFGAFEDKMPVIAAWFRDNPPKATGSPPANAVDPRT